MVDSITGRMSVQRYVDILSDAGFKAVFGDQRNKDVLIDLLNFILLENRKVRDLSYSSTEIPGFSLDSLPEELRTDVFERLFRACEIAKFDRDTKLTYEKDMITERDYQNIIDTAAEDGRAVGFAEGRSEGLAEGEAKGKAEERVMIAKAMIEEGIDTHTIAKVTGLSCEEIASL